MTAPIQPPLSWQVLESVRALLQQITQANGFYTNAGATVLLENSQVPDDALPALFVTGVPTDPAAAQGRTVRIGSQEIQIEGRIPTGRAQAQRIAHELIDDLLRAIPTRSDALPLGCKKLSIESCDIGARADGQPFISVVVVLRAGLVTAGSPA